MATSQQFHVIVECCWKSTRKMLSGNRIKGGKYKVKKKNKDKSMRTHLREPAYVSVVLWGCEIILLTEHNFNSDCDCINYCCYYKFFFLMPYGNWHWTL